MTGNANQFKQKLKIATGLSDSAISAAWPQWWSSGADSSLSAQAELRFSLARKLGLDPRSVINDDDTPVFLGDDSAKFKNSRGDTVKEKLAITSFGLSLGRILLEGSEPKFSIVGESAENLRSSMLQNTSFIGIEDLLSFVWRVGIPLVHLRIDPLSAKRMCAMTVHVKGRFAILLARDSLYPAPLMLDIAHEIAHIALGHLGNETALVDMDNKSERCTEDGVEEIAANKFALELLTGSSEPEFEMIGEVVGAKQLAEAVTRTGNERQIEPGTLALCYGYSTKNWTLVNRALRFIYDSTIETWKPINQLATDEISWENISEDSCSYIRAVLGGK